MEIRLARRLLFCSGVLVLLLSTGTGVGADEPDSPTQIFLWSSRGPVAVQRDAQPTASGADSPWPERLLLELLKGPTPAEMEAGLETAIPEGTTLAELVEQPDGTVVVRLEMPLDAPPSLTHDSFEATVHQVGDTLRSLDWRDLRIEVREPDGSFVPLAEFLPEISVSRKTAVVGLAAPHTAQAVQSPAFGQGQPAGALAGKTVYVSAGHGWHWAYDGRCGCARWKTQRPAYPSGSSYDGPIIEDHNNAEAVNQYLLQYLWNSGAAVWPTRERDMNPAEVIVNNDAPAPGTGYTETGLWSTTSTAGTGYDGSDYRWADTVAGEPTASATWQASLPVDGRYGVYAWYKPGDNRAQKARYVVHHAGGDTTVTIDQRVHGSTWHYLGTYGFLADDDARVTLTNQSNAPGQAAIADAVRFGGGTFNDLTGTETGADYPPEKPWWEVASFYYTQKMGMEPALSDVTARPIYARWEHGGTGDDAVYVSWHTNGYNGTIRGTETYAHNGTGQPRTAGSLELRHAIHSQVIHDIRAGWDSEWADRGEKQANLGELRELWDDEDPTARMPGALIEIAFHDNPEDTDALKDPKFNMLVARALYKGIVKYYEQRDGVTLTLLPEPPKHVVVRNIGGGAVRVSWEPSPTDSQGLLGDPPIGYRVYTSTNGIGWSDGKLVTDGTTTTLTDLPKDEVVYVRVTAVNQGGESFSTETLATRVGDRTGILLVNGFTRLDNTLLIDDNDPIEGYNKRMLLDRMNRYDYVIQHTEAIPYPFDSAGSGAVDGGFVALDTYRLVDWILGEESYDDKTLNHEEQALLRDYLDGGGALFISGSEIGWDLYNLGDAASKEFFTRYLRAAFRGDNAETWEVAPVPGSIFDGLGSFRFDAPGMYRPDYPDQLGVSYDSVEALTYQGGRGGVAATQYADGCERVVTFGFPFETINPESRGTVMDRVLDFLDECLDLPGKATIISPLDGSAHNTAPAFEGSTPIYSREVERVEIQLGRRSDAHWWTGEEWADVDNSIWLTADGTTNWSYELPGDPEHLLDDTYVLQARTCADDGTCDTRPDQVEFIYDTIGPPSTNVITPTGGITLRAARVELQWQAVEQDSGSEIGYQVRINGREYTTSEPTYAVWLSGLGPHTWTVRVVDQAGNESEWDDEATFFLEQSHCWLPLVLREFDH